MNQFNSMRLAVRAAVALAASLSLLSPGAHAAIEKPARVLAPTGAQTSSILAEYVRLHRTAYEGAAGDAVAKTKACREPRIVVGAVQGTGVRR